MNRDRLLNIALIVSYLCLAGVLKTYGQTEGFPPTFGFGPFIAYEYGLPLALDRSPGAVEWCAFCDGTGTSYNHRGRFGGFIQLIPFSTFSTDLRLSLSIASGQFTSNSYIAPFVDPETLQAIQTNRFFTVNALVAGIDLQVQAKTNLTKKWQIGFGSWLEYWLLSRFVHREELLSPAEVTFPESFSRTRVIAEGDLLGSGPFALGGIISTSYEFPLLPRLHVIPELYTRIDGWGLTNGLGLQSATVGISFAFKQVFPDQPLQPPTTTTLPSPPSPPPLPPTNRLTAEIDLYANNSNGVKSQEALLLPRRTLYKRHTPPQKEWIVDDYLLPSIGITPQIVADAGVQLWTLSIRKDSEEIARLTSEDADQQLNLDIELADGLIPNRLTAELIVEDSTGALVAARDHLPFIVEIDSTKQFSQSLIEDQWLLSPLKDKKSSLEKNILQEILSKAQSSREVLIILSSVSKEMQQYAGMIKSYLKENAPQATVRITSDTSHLQNRLTSSDLLITIQSPWHPTGE